MSAPQIVFINPSEELKAQLARQERVVRSLVQSGALDIRGGSFTAHFDADGELRKVERSDTLFRS